MSDTFDPCAILATLRPAYYALLGGTQTQEVEFRAGNGTSRRVKYTAANLPALRAEIARLETQCAASTGIRRRHVILAG